MNHTTKLFSLGMALCCTVTLFAGCDKDEKNEVATKTCAEIGASVIAAEISFPEMVNVNADNFQVRYALAATDYTEYCVYWAGDGAVADEVCIIQTTGGDQLKKVKEAVEARRTAQITTYQDYAPQQSERLKESTVTTRGNYVFWSVCDENAIALGVFNQAFGG